MITAVLSFANLPRAVKKNNNMVVKKYHGFLRVCYFSQIRVQRLLTYIKLMNFNMFWAKIGYLAIINNLANTGCRF